MDIRLDEGYFYGFGVFETIDVREKHPVLLDFHLERINKALKKLNIEKEVKKEEVLKYIEENNIISEVLKISVSAENTVYSTRKNIYTKDKFEKGFKTGLSSVIRNESSMFTYIKSFNCGDNIIEKRRAKEKGIDEPVFLNSKGELTEGAVSNIFFVKNGKIFTPKLSCGMLDGVLRRYIIETYKAEETIIYPENAVEFDEMFVTNSLMGVMPVISFEDKKFRSADISRKILKEYENKRNNL